MEPELLQIGQSVSLLAYGDEVIKRRVVDFDDRHVYICREDEWQAAKQEGREPRCVGFKRSDIVEARGES
jgi:hypothetical protein